ncbi:hypothetical protein INT46_004889 [Mucor plumbeus]|uniref:Uncharacterized protein n=1 Tax=Mucor plumbeus TaxID=97098 RepID=A0A8H7QM69_9FUNG|nr:hypothetical protein INT46_004889 [Mucor plumbeus]
MEHEIQSLRLRNNELKNLLTRVDTDIRFLDHQALKAYEREERTTYNDFRNKITDFKDRYRGDSAGKLSNILS